MPNHCKASKEEDCQFTYVPPGMMKGGEQGLTAVLNSGPETDAFFLASPTHMAKKAMSQPTRARTQVRRRT